MLRLDVQVRGELVPGLESWINYGFLVARERFRPDFATARRDGLIPRPTDQRHTISAFVQDQVPGDDSWTIHMRALFGSGLPYTPPREGPQMGGIVLQVPGNRSSRVSLSTCGWTWESRRRSRSATSEAFVPSAAGDG
jgi:hypothetical protein